jgi:RND family efflux transporter MFP subunit
MLRPVASASPAWSRAILAPALALAALLASAPASGQGAAPGPMPVSVANPVKREVADMSEFTGRFEASALVEVRAQVSGQLMEVAFKDGAEVKKGDLLFKIDPRPYEAALTQAESAVITAKTRVDLTQADVERAKDLRRTGNITDQVAQQRQQAYGEALSTLKSAEAQVATARLNLEWTDVRAPISGRIGRKMITEGNLIAAGAGSMALTTIVGVDPMWFYFDVDEQSYLRYLGYVRDGEIKRDDDGTPVTIALSNETDFRHKGRIDFADNQMDAQSGTLRLRATVPNPDRYFTPGLFGRVRVQSSPRYEALLVPDEAIQADQTRKIVMVVGPDDKVAPKVVETGQLNDGLRVIKSGLSPDDRVIVNGLMRARPGAQVKPETVDITKPQGRQAAAAPAPAK